MIEINGLTKRYRDLVAVNDVSFSVAAGEIVGFLGPNGAGKTTTMKMLTGFLPATSGKATVAGFDVFDSPMDVKRSIGYLPEIPPVYPDLTVREYLRFVGKLKGLRGGDLKSNVDESIEKVSLQLVADRLIRNISKGYQQRTGLAQALLGKPRVLILDEPTVGLDPRQIGEVRTLIQSLAGDHTVILSTHILQEVTAVCDRVVIINKGSIVADDNLDHLVKEHTNDEGQKSLEEIFLSLTEL
ncbi:MAG: ATP-binding cassette domain-containing protein [Deltaproteobacteria bacterium]|jgi:ABC-2 type transport system ATP-binding protein|nr:ATP-binding cassette domain-containing protein [Deltaproteobacteria bacterium]MBT6435490.1 ATP-binding cassette domain-containing protein [Deltaproteobacteria bacterium]MBT6489987.1 ATP-binding cassette domain-containing protein [Deltaproteobacteria bacterium]